MFRDLLFVQGDEARPLLDMLDEQGAPALVDYLAEINALNWEGELAEKLRAGTSDHIEQVERYHVTSNFRLSYIGVEYFHFQGELA